MSFPSISYFVAMFFRLSGRLFERAHQEAMIEELPEDRDEGFVFDTSGPRKAAV
jgi:hypothetical protein